MRGVRKIARALLAAALIAALPAFQGVTPHQPIAAEAPAVAAWVSRGATAVVLQGDAAVFAAAAAEFGEIWPAALQNIPHDQRGQVITLLVAWLSDNSEYVRRAAAAALGVLAKDNPGRSNDIVTALLQSLSDNDWKVRSAAAAALGALAKDNPGRSNDIVTALLQSLSDNDWKVRSAAAAALGALAKDNPGRSNDIVTALLQSLSDNNPYVRDAAARGLRVLAKDNPGRSNDIVTALLQSLSGNDPYVSIAAAAALGVLKNNPGRGNDIVTALLQSLRGNASDVRRAAAAALGGLAKDNPGRSNDIVATLLQSLSDNASDVRSAAAAALGVLAKDNPGRSNDIVATLLQSLSDNASDVRSAAAAALGVLAKDNPGRSNDIVTALLQSLSDNGSDVRRAAAAALGVLAKDNPGRSNDIVTALLQSLSDNGSDVRSAAAAALGVLAKDNPGRSNDIVAALLQSLSDNDPDVSSAAAAALGVLATGRSNDIVAALLQSLSDNDPDVRSAAAAALGVLAKDNPGRSNDIVTALLQSLSGNDQFVRRAAAAALGVLAKDNPARSNDIVTALLQSLSDNDSDVRRAAAAALGVLAKDNPGRSNDIVTALLQSLSDNDWDVRRTAAAALGVLAKDNPGRSNDIVTALLQSLSDNDPDVRRAAAQALANRSEALTASGAAMLLEVAAGQALSEAPRMEALFHVLTGGDRQPALLLPVLRRTQREQVTEYRQPDATLALFVTIWPSTKPSGELRRQIAWHARKIAESLCTGPAAAPGADALPLPKNVAEIWALVRGLSPAGCLSAERRDVIRGLGGLFQKAGLPEGRDLDRVLKDDEERDRRATTLWWIIGTVASHTALWVALLFLYPRHRWVQAAFFWNPWVRRLLGLHLSFLIPLLPFARRRLLAPFRAQLGPTSASAGAIHAVQTAWFPDAEVTEGGAPDRIPITQALPRIDGLTILEGASGLGKTVHLVRLARDPKRVVAFIQAGEQGGDVIKALAARLPAEVMRDEAFLRTLIHAGGMDICIDGLNEVSAEARAAIASFAQAATRANVLISTQPIRWNRPAGARLLHLQPLRAEQQRAFLESRTPLLPESAPLREARFKARVAAFVDEMVRTTPAVAEERVARDRALSNPMDLTTIALILANGGAPDLLNLQQTAYLQAAKQYGEANQSAEFPLTAFSEFVYEERCKATGQERELIVLRNQRFTTECDALADHRLLLRTEEPDPDGGKDGKSVPTWRFRHDKVLDFFLFVAITQPKTMKQRVAEHQGDTRFRGVYLLLALRAPLDVAKDIRDRLNDRAVETRDHTLSDEVWQIVRQRLDQLPAAVVQEELAETG